MEESDRIVDQLDGNLHSGGQGLGPSVVESFDDEVDGVRLFWIVRD